MRVLAERRVTFMAIRVRIIAVRVRTIAVRVRIIAVRVQIRVLAERRVTFMVAFWRKKAFETETAAAGGADASTTMGAVRMPCRSGGLPSLLHAQHTGWLPMRVLNPPVAVPDVSTRSTLCACEILLPPIVVLVVVVVRCRRLSNQGILCEYSEIPN